MSIQVQWIQSITLMARLAIMRTCNEVVHPPTLVAVPKVPQRPVSQRIKLLDARRFDRKLFISAHKVLLCYLLYK